MTDEIYCDYAATSPFDREIMQKAFDVSMENYANPSSVHDKGIEAKRILTEARTLCAKSLGVKESNVYFTSGGTESDFLPIISLLQKPNKGSIVISSIEHPAVREMAENMKNCGWKVKIAQCDKNGMVTPESVCSQIEDDTSLVCIMAVNNETGAIQPVYSISDAISECCKGKRRPKFHVDCVQAAGKIPLNLSYKGIDSASISGHKIGAARGIGLYYLKDRQEPFLRGGGQENGIRSGTENLFGIVSLSLALEKYFILDENSKSYKSFIEHQRLSEKFIAELEKMEKCILVPSERTLMNDRFSPFVVQAAFKNIPGEVLVRELSARKIYISTGSACSSKKQSRPVLDAMNIPKDVAGWGVRFSFSQQTTESEMEKLLEQLHAVTKKF